MTSPLRELTQAACLSQQQNVKNHTRERSASHHLPLKEEEEAWVAQGVRPNNNFENKIFLTWNSFLM